MSYLFKETGFPFMNIRCIENGKINRENCQFVSEEIANGQYKHFQLEENDLIVSTSGTLGKKAFVTKNDLPLLLNTSIIRFKPKDENKLSRYFLNYLLESHSFLYDLLNQSTGSAQVNVGPSHLEKLWVNIPENVKEQTRIAETLSAADARIAKTERLIAKYTRIKTGLMQDLLTRGIDADGNIRSRATHKFVIKNGIEVPEDWDVVRLVDKFTFPSGQVNPTVEPFCDWYLIAPDHIESETGRLLELKTAREQGAISGKYKFQKGDVIYSKIRPYLKKAVLAETEGLCSADMYPLRPKDDLDPNYLLYLILDEPFSRFAIAASSRSGFPKLNRTEFAEYMTPLPSIDEQKEISSILKNLDKAIIQEESEREKSIKIKTGLMQDLLSGKVRVKAES